MANKKGVKYYDNKLWKIFSEYIRRRDANTEGMVKCYTCPAVKHWKECDAGHFVSRNAKAIKFDEKNVQVQCKACNGFYGGMSYKFGLNLDRDYGEGTAEKLELQRHTIIKRSPQDYEDLIAEFTEKLSKLDA
jgi:hypothetical protein